MHNIIIIFFSNLTFGTEHQSHKRHNSWPTMAFFKIFYFCNIIKMPQIEYSQWGKYSICVKGWKSTSETTV